MKTETEWHEFVMGMLQVFEKGLVVCVNVSCSKEKKREHQSIPVSLEEIFSCRSFRS